eukprot:gene17941-24344_t
MVKITAQNAGLLTNSEVMQVLQDRGVGDTLHGRALPSEKMLFMYLQDNTPDKKSPEQLLEFTKDMAVYNLSRAELLQIINLVPFSVVEDLINERSSQPEVFCLQHDMTIAEGLKALSKRKILSAPLMVSVGLEDLEVTEVPQEPSLFGWVDVNDILRGLLSYLHDKHKKDKLPSNMLQLMTELEGEGKTFGSKSLVSLAGGEDRSLIFQADATTKLLDTIKDSFLKTQSNGRVIHRLAIFDAHGAITNIFAQLDVMKYLCNNAPLVFGELGNSSIEELGFLSNRMPVTTVVPNSPTILAFEQMISDGVSAAAVISEKGEMIANLSVSDIRCIQPEHLGVLALPVAEFLALLHQTAYLGYSQRSSESSQHPFFAGSPKVRPSIVIPFSPGNAPSHTNMSSGEMNDAEVRPSIVIPSSPGNAPSHMNMSPGEMNDAEVRLIAAKPTSTLREVLQLLSDNHVHRVYVMDATKTPQVAMHRPTHKMNRSNCQGLRAVDQNSCSSLTEENQA